MLIKNKLDEINGIVLTIKKQDKEPLVELVRSYLRKDKRTKEVVSRKEIHFLPMLTEYEKWINSTSYNNRTSTKRSTNTSIKQIREYSSEYQTKNNVIHFVYHEIQQSLPPLYMALTYTYFCFNLPLIISLHGSFHDQQSRQKMNKNSSDPW